MTSDVLKVGIDFSKVDLSSFPSLVGQDINAAGKRADEMLKEAGFITTTCVLDPSDASAQALETLLRRQSFQCIMIGAGLRTLPQYRLLFERAINHILRLAPECRICFNSEPEDTLEAVQRSYSFSNS